MTGVVPAATRRAEGVGIRRRSPVRAAVWSLVTVSIYGFWWWWQLNRQLRDLGQPARPWRALAQVVLGWLVVLVPLLAGWPWAVVLLGVVPILASVSAVSRTATLLAALQRGGGATRPVSARLAAAITVVALVGAVLWLALSLAAVPAALAFGIVWPLVAMVLVGYLQAGLNDALDAQG